MNNVVYQIPYILVPTISQNTNIIHIMLFMWHFFIFKEN